MTDRDAALPRNASGLENLVGYRLRRAHLAIAPGLAALLEGLGLRRVTFAVLSVIQTNPGISLVQVGRLLGIHRANMTRLIDDLSQPGFVERRCDPTDKRKKGLNVTPAGDRIVERANTIIRAHEDRILRFLTGAQRQKLLILLGKIVDTDDDR